MCISTRINDIPMDETIGMCSDPSMNRGYNLKRIKLMQRANEVKVPLQHFDDNVVQE